MPGLSRLSSIRKGPPMSKRDKTREAQELEAASARILGRHVSREKGILLLTATVLACVAPMVLGLRLWDELPAVIETGLVDANGRDDSLPRWALVFMVPGLFTLLDLITHVQFLIHQKKNKVPPKQIRFFGRWGWPLVALVCCAVAMPRCAGRGEIVAPLLTSWALGLLMMLLGGQFLDCPRDARIALRFPECTASEEVWRAVHRFSGALWLAMGLLVIYSAAMAKGASLLAAAPVAAAVLAPLVYAKALGQRAD